MQLVDPKKRGNLDELEPVLYAALVDSMCQNFLPMFAGSICIFAAAVFTALKTGNELLWPFAVLIIAIGTVRAFEMRNYEQRTKPLTYAQARYLEPRYAAGAIVFAGILGAWSFLTIYANDDAVAHMVCVAVTIGYTAGGAARNYGQPRLIQYHILLACGPMSLALALHGGFYYVGLAVLLALFFIGLRGINLSLHAIFVKALTSSFRESALAGQFDTALNNMPHGLCMFRDDGRLAVMNHRFSEIMNLSDDLVQSGVKEGAEIFQHACKLPAKGFYFRPTVFSGVTQSHRIAREEIFGPVLSVLTFRTVEEAIEKANNTAFGLSAGVWTDKGSRILKMSTELKAGVVWANTFNKFDPASPFGGYKESGFGREGGRQGLMDYCKLI